jgi:uncharacterized protein YciW
MTKQQATIRALQSRIAKRRAFINYFEIQATALATARAMARLFNVDAVHDDYIKNLSHEKFTTRRLIKEEADSQRLDKTLLRSLQYAEWAEIQVVYG